MAQSLLGTIWAVGPLNIPKVGKLGIHRGNISFLSGSIESVATVLVSTEPGDEDEY